MKLWTKVFVTLLVACLAGFTTGAQSQQTGDPVADAARKAREQKKDAPKPKKVYTDDDVKKSAPEAAAAPAAAPVDASGTATASTSQSTGNATKAEDPTKKEDPNGEAAWRKKFQVQHDKIAKAEKELDVLNRELEKAQIEYYPDPQKAMTQQNTRGDINATNAKIDAKKKELDQLRQQLSDMEDQLRKSGGDPGWAR